jgi:hypothetical protein
MSSSSSAAATSTPSPAHNNGGVGSATSLLTGSGSKIPRRGGSSNKGFNSRSYPRGICIDFRKVSQELLLDYVHHHGKAEQHKMILLLLVFIVD